MNAVATISSRGCQARAPRVSVSIILLKRHRHTRLLYIAQPACESLSEFGFGGGEQPRNLLGQAGGVVNVWPAFV